MCCFGKLMASIVFYGTSLISFLTPSKQPNDQNNITEEGSIIEFREKSNVNLSTREPLKEEQVEKRSMNKYSILQGIKAHIESSENISLPLKLQVIQWINISLYISIMDLDNVCSPGLKCLFCLFKRRFISDCDFDLIFNYEFKKKHPIYVELLCEKHLENELKINSTQVLIQGKKPILKHQQAKIPIQRYKLLGKKH